MDSEVEVAGTEARSAAENEAGVATWVAFAAVTTEVVEVRRTEVEADSLEAKIEVEAEEDIR